MGKRYVLVRNNKKSQSNIIHAPICALIDMSIYQGQEGLTKVYIIFAEFQGIRQGPRLPSSRYGSAEDRVDPV